MSEQPTGLTSEIAGSLARHGAGYLAGVLAASGAISHDQQAQAVTVITSVLVYAIVQGWSFWRKIQRAGRFQG